MSRRERPPQTQSRNIIQLDDFESFDGETEEQQQERSSTFEKYWEEINRLEKRSELIHHTIEEIKVFTEFHFLPIGDQLKYEDVEHFLNILVRL